MSCSGGGCRNFILQSHESVAVAYRDAKLKAAQPRSKKVNFIVASVKKTESPKEEKSQDFFAMLVMQKKKISVPGEKSIVQSVVEEEKKLDHILAIPVKVQRDKEEVLLKKENAESVEEYIEFAQKTLEDPSMEMTTKNGNHKWIRRDRILNNMDVKYDYSLWFDNSGADFQSELIEDQFDERDLYALNSRHYMKSRPMNNVNIDERYENNKSTLSSIELNSSRPLDDHMNRFKNIESLLFAIEDFDSSESLVLWGNLCQDVFHDFLVHVNHHRLYESYKIYSRKQNNMWNQNFDDELPVKRRSFARFLYDFELKLARLNVFERVCGDIFSQDVKLYIVDFLYGRIYDFLRNIPEYILQCCRFFHYPNQIESSYSLVSEFRCFSLRHILEKMHALTFVPDYEVIKSLFLFFEHPTLLIYLGYWWFPVVNFSSTFIDLTLSMNASEAINNASKKSYSSLIETLSVLQAWNLPFWVSHDFSENLAFLANLIRLCRHMYHLSLEKRISHFGRSQIIRGAINILLETLAHVIIFVKDLRDNYINEKMEIMHNIESRSYIIASLISTLSFFVLKDLREIHWHICLYSDLFDTISYSPLKALLETLDFIILNDFFPRVLSKYVVKQKTMLLAASDRFNESVHRSRVVLHAISSEEPCFKLRGNYFKITRMYNQEKNFDHANTRKCCAWWVVTGVCTEYGKKCKKLHPLWAFMLLPKYCVHYLTFRNCENPVCVHLHSCYVIMDEKYLHARAEEKVQDTPFSATSLRLEFSKILDNYVEYDFSSFNSAFQFQAGIDNSL
jgi:hypothetical protein